ncbi:MAG: O-methyltransferase [Flammeovirgaceae bacterium]
MLHQVKAYLNYLWHAKNEKEITAPFVAELYTDVIKSVKAYYQFSELEALRSKLLKDEQVLAVTDFGAGSRVMKSNQRKISEIAEHSLGSQKECELLFKLVNHLKPDVMLELGTSLGLNTIYQAIPQSFNTFYTFEGCPNIAEIAQRNFDHFKVKPELIIGNLDETLAETVSSLEKIDYAYFDANHRYEPTVNYFNICLKKAHEHTLFVFDDIHWSAGMEKAWEEIRTHERVTLSIDLFSVGLVFFRKDEEKTHFTLRF